MSIKAIQTRHDGYYFRSRLEARWAVFFNEMKIPYKYEIEGFNVGNKRYLPDFFLPLSKTWVEVKGDLSTLDYELLGLCVDNYGDGLPFVRDSCETDRGLLILGAIPYRQIDSNNIGVMNHILLQHDRGGRISRGTFAYGYGAKFEYNDYGYFAMTAYDCNLDTLKSEIHEYLENNYTPKYSWPTKHILNAYSTARSYRF
jgi:hypothetical protein